MCKIITIINHNKENIPVLQKLITANVEKMAEEQDGYSTYRDGVSTFYTDYKGIGDNLAYAGERIYMAHTRTRTTGGTGVDGLHLQRIKDRYVFAHNGSISKYADVKDKNDSYYFFDDLIKMNISKKNIEKHSEKSSFWGRAFLYDELLDRFHIFCNNPLYFTMLPDCLVISTFELVIEEPAGEKKFNTLGLDWFIETPGKRIQGLLGTLDLDDTYMVFHNGKMSYRTDIDTKKYEPKTPSIYTGNGGKYPWKDDDDDDELYGDAKNRQWWNKDKKNGKTEQKHFLT